MKRLNLTQFPEVESQYWALIFSPSIFERSPIHSIGQMGATRPDLWGTIGEVDQDTHIAELRNPEVVVPVAHGVSTFIAQRTEEAKLLLAALRQLDYYVVVSYSEGGDDSDDEDSDEYEPEPYPGTYYAEGEDEDIAAVETLIAQLMSADLLDPYQIDYHRDRIAIAAQTDWFCNQGFLGVTVWLGDSTSVSAVLMEETGPNYLSGFGKGHSSQIISRTPLAEIPGAIRENVLRWVSETRVVLGEDNHVIGTLRPGVVDYLNGGGELHCDPGDDIEVIAMKTHGLFTLQRELR